MPTTDHTDRDFDHLDASMSAAEVRQTYAQLREGCPVSHNELYGGFDHLTRYSDVRNALTDSASYSSADGVFLPPSGLPPVPALEFDEPAHSLWREVLDPPLTPRAVQALEPTITEVVDLLIDDFAEAGKADLVSAFAEPLPAIVIGRMVGLNQDQAVEARSIAAELFASIGTPDFAQHMAEFTAYTQQRLEERRADPRDDFLTEMASGVVRGMPIDDIGVAGLMVAYIVGGHHSTASGVAGLLRHTLTHPGLGEQLPNDRKLLARVIEESLRLTTPLQLFARTTTCPVTVADEQLPTGRRVMLNLAAANRDPREFEDPEAFNPYRARNRHVAFGAGTHVCQGQHLARAELRISISRLLERLPDIRLDGEIAASGLTGGVLMTLHSMPVAFTPQKR